jgi:protein-disulfide isomerase
MAPDEMRGTARSSSHSSKLGDVALAAALVGIIVILAVSIVNQRELRRLSARVTQLETLAAAPAAQGAVLNKVYEVDVATAPAKGPSTATVTIAEFSDFQCPFCLGVNPTIKQLEDTYKDRVRFVWKHLPLVGIHPHAMSAAVAAEAARNQGKFWEYHDKLFANQERLELGDLKQYAQELGLDIARFDKDRDDPELKTKVQADMAEATALGVKSTPTFFINGRLVRGAMPFETFATIIDQELAKPNTSPAPKASSSN